MAHRGCLVPRLFSPTPRTAALFDSFCPAAAGAGLARPAPGRLLLQRQHQCLSLDDQAGAKIYPRLHHRFDHFWPVIGTWPPRLRMCSWQAGFQVCLPAHLNGHCRSAAATTPTPCAPASLHAPPHRPLVLLGGTCPCPVDALFVSLCSAEHAPPAWPPAWPLLPGACACLTLQPHFEEETPLLGPVPRPLISLGPRMCSAPVGCCPHTPSAPQARCSPRFCTPQQCDPPAALALCLSAAHAPIVPQAQGNNYNAAAAIAQKRCVRGNKVGRLDSGRAALANAADSRA